jgi:hypothetical protein
LGSDYRFRDFRNTGKSAIRLHAFFKGIDWEALELKKVKPPFQPQIKSRRDALNFDSEYTNEHPILTLNNKEVKDPFDGFSFINLDYISQTKSTD